MEIVGGGPGVDAVEERLGLLFRRVDVCVSGGDGGVVCVVGDVSVWVGR